MYSESILDSFSIWLILCAIFIMIMIFIEAGYLFGLRVFKSRNNEGYTTMSAGVASLLAFILALTFNMSAGRNDARKQLVIEESNLISTAYLRSDLLPTALAVSSKALLKRYTALRASNSQDLNEVNHLIRESEKIHSALWALAIRVDQQTASHGGKLYIESINRLLDVHTLRIHRGIKGRIPPVIWGSLILLTFFAMLLSGLQNGAKNNPRMIAARIPFGLAFSIIFSLIIELDRPARSVISVDQSALLLLHQSME